MVKQQEEEGSDSLGYYAYVFRHPKLITTFLFLQALLEVISTLQFEHVESLWQSFYKSPAAVNKNDNGTLEANDYSINKQVNFLGMKKSA